MTSPRSRASFNNTSRAGTSPSVNLPIIPLVDNDSNPALFRWALNLITQLDIWFEQIKATIIQLASAIDERVTWLEPYTGQDVPRNTIVEDDGWLMISNKATNERAAPVIHGPPEFIYSDTPAFVTVSDTSLVKSVMSTTLNTGALCEEFRVWVPTIGPTVDHYFVIEITAGTPAIPYTRTYFNPILTPNQWTILALADLPLASGSQIRLEMYTINRSSESPQGPFEYVYGGSNVEPESGEWTRSSNNRTIAASKFDNGGVDRSLNIEAITAGSVLEFIGVINPVDDWKYIASSPAVLDAGGQFYSITVTRVTASGSFSVGEVCLLNGSVPVAAPAEYSEIPNYFPAGNPSWGEFTSELYFDDVAQTGVATTGFGLGMGVAPGTVAEDWDYMNYANLTDNGIDGTRGYSNRNQRENGGHVIEGAIRTLDGAWTEVIRFDVFDTHKGDIFTRAIRSGVSDAYSSHWNYLCLLNGSLNVQATKIYEHSTAPTIRTRIDSSGTQLIVDVQGKAGQTWDWSSKLIKRGLLDE